MQGTAPTGGVGGAGAVTPPPDPTTVKVGVLLARGPAELGDWLADAAAFEAAGAHALWVDPEPESKLDPRKPIVARESGGPLEREDGPGIVAADRAHLPERELDARAVGVAERRGGLERLDGLRVREQPPGMQPGFVVGRGRLGIAAGRPLMMGDEEQAREVGLTSGA